MKLVLSLRAARQLDEILDYIAQRHPQGAHRVQARVKEVFDLLLRQPMAGTATGHRDGRRMVTSPYPYIIYYRVHGNEIRVQRVRHAARRPL